MARTAATANKAAFKNALAKNRRTASGRPMAPLGIFYVEVDVPLATTDLQAADVLTFIEFPDVCYLLGGSVTVTDLDSDATPAIVFDINVNDGSTDVALVNDSTIGQGGGSAAFSHGKIPGYDVSGYTLNLTPSVSADVAVAGTLTVRLLVSTTVADNI